MTDLLRPSVVCALLVVIDSKQVGIFPFIDDECKLAST